MNKVLVRSLKGSKVYSSAGLILLAATVPVRAANLLTNPGFESPSDPGNNVDTMATGWTFVGDSARATFVNHTAGGSWSIWEKTFENPVFPSTWGVFQNFSDGFTAGTTYTLTAYKRFESGFNQSTATDKLILNWLDGSGNPVGTPAETDIPASSNPPVDTWTQYMVSGVAPVGATQVQVFLGWSGGTVVSGSPQSSFTDDVDLEGAGAPPSIATWGINGSGDWNVSGNWTTGTVPNGAGIEADFLGSITLSHTVYTDVGVTAGTLKFNNTNTYVIAGAGSLTLDGGLSGNAKVIVQAGSQKLNLPVTFASNTDITVSAGATLTIGNPATINANKTVNKTGNVLIQAPLTILSGGVLNIASGNTTLFNAPALSSGAKINVQNNSLLIDYRGQSTPAATILAQLTSGYNGGAWNGQGINTTSAIANQTGLGWKDNPSSSSILVKYALYGDADLSGTVDSVDFNILAANFSQGGRVWSQADFNYSGTTDSIDFNLLASNFSKSLPGDSVGGLVPEPASGAALLIGGLLMARRGRRS